MSDGDWKTVRHAVERWPKEGAADALAALARLEAEAAALRASADAACERLVARAEKAEAERDALRLRWDGARQHGEEQARMRQELAAEAHTLRVEVERLRGLALSDEDVGRIIGKACEEERGRVAKWVEQDADPGLDREDLADSIRRNDL